MRNTTRKFWDQVTFHTLFTLALGLLLAWTAAPAFADSASATYTAGDIPTDSGFQGLGLSSHCPGMLTVPIPVGARITGVDVSYTMTAKASGWMSQQVSQLRCTSSGGASESQVFYGVSDTTGTYTYQRTGLAIANGVQGGGDVTFELHAGRTWPFSGCDTFDNKVDNNSWTVTVYYEPPTNPNIYVKGNGTDIFDGDTTPSTADATAFGSISFVNGSVTHTFTITNVGAVTPLNISGVTVDNTTDFAVTALPTSPVAPGGQATFAITFDPQSIGLKTAMVAIVNDTPDDRSTYTFAIQGIGMADPAITVSGNGVNIADGDAVPALADAADFGGVPVGGSDVTHTFTIANVGASQDLHISSVTVDNPTNFAVTALPVSPIAPGGQATFTITFTPQSSGLKTAAVTIVNDTPDDRGVFTFTIQGRGNAAMSTYTAGDLPSDFGFQTLGQSSSCPGTLTVTIPEGVRITGVDVSYTMTAQNSVWMSKQRSQLRCTSPGGASENAVYSGVDNTPGTYTYQRTGLTIANNVAGGGAITFELHAGLAYSGSGCTTYNKVDNNSWTVTVWYAQNMPPTDISLSNSSVAEHEASGTLVGTFSTTDPDVGDTHTYSLVTEGCAGTDNASFAIPTGTNELRTAAMFDYEIKSSYAICVQTDDGNGGTYQEAFTITVTDVNYTISGTITDGTNPLAGVTLSGLPGNPATQSDGTYTASVDAGWSGTVTPQKANYTFTPVSRSYPTLTGDVSAQDYTGAPPTLHYPGTSFEESPANNGTMITTIPIRLTGDAFTGADGAAFDATKWTANPANPAGLTVAIDKVSATSVVVRLTGTATSQTDTSVTLTFLDGAFVGGNAAIVVHVSQVLTLDFQDQPAGFVRSIGFPSFCSAAMADFDQNGKLELVVTAGSTVSLVSATGVALATDALGLPYGLLGSSPLLADVDGDARPEIIALDTLGYVHVWGVSGGTLTHLFAIHDAAIITNVSLLATPAIGDLDGQNGLDIAWGGDNSSGGASLTAYDLRTQLKIPGFPVSLGTVAMGAMYPRTTAVALANLDTDPEKEIVIGYNNLDTGRGEVKQINHDGAVMRTYQMAAGEYIGTGSVPPVDVVASAPTLGDVYRVGASAGTFELVIGGSQGTVYIWDTADGSAHHYTPGGSVAISAAPALADLNGDGHLDVVIANTAANLYAFDHNGTAYQTLWMANLGDAPVTAPTIGDVDGDDALEVVVARMRSGKVFVLNPDGTEWPLTAGTAGQISAPPTIADVDRDDDLEILAVDDANLYLWHGSTQHPGPIIQGYPVDRGNVRRDGAMPNVALYPLRTVDTSYTAGTGLYQFNVVIQNRGTDTADNVVVRYAGYEDGNLVKVLKRTATAPTATIAAGAEWQTTDFIQLDLTEYAKLPKAGRPAVYFYFDLTYTDSAGSEYLVHR
jgi:hypothetical protein